MQVGAGGVKVVVSGSRGNDDMGVVGSRVVDDDVSNSTVEVGGGVAMVSFFAVQRQR